MSQPPPPPRHMHRPLHVAGHMLRGAVMLLPFIGVVLLLGMLMYHEVEGLPWADAFLNAAMLLGGMGPVDRLQTTAGKWLAGIYALVAGLGVIVLAGVMLAPVVHHVLQRFHIDDRD